MFEHVTLILIGVTVAASIYAWNNPEIQQKWMFNPFAVHNARQYYRFLSSGFIHTNSMHLLFNMIALFFFGGVIERIYENTFGGIGILLYLITYLAGIVVSNIKTYIKYKDSSYYNSLGASGGVASILFASILYRPTASICLYFAICIPAFILGAIYLIYSYYSGRRMSDNVNHDAHLFGSLFGIIFTILLRPAVLIEFIERIKNFNLYEFQFL
jgi:membrane associated rhomboid family serine protease